MTNNHLLLYRLAELMMEKQQHILALDDLFEDEQIGVFVRSIQIDSPYQQLIFDGVLTETIKEERIMVTFTVEGYFHYVLGEVIEKQTIDKGAKALKDLLENNKLRGITEGVEQCLVRDIEKNDLSRLMLLIDVGGKALDSSTYPLAQAFLIHPIQKVIDVLLANPTENDILALEKAIENLENAQLIDKVKSLYQVINYILEPNNFLEASLYAKSIKHITKENRFKALNKLSLLKIEHDNEVAVDFYYSLASQFYFISNYDKAIEYYEKSLDIGLKKNDLQNSSVENSFNQLGSIYNDKGEFDKAIEYYQKSLTIKLNTFGNQHPNTAISFNNLGDAWYKKEHFKVAIEFLEKSLVIDLKTFGYWHPSTAVTFNNMGNVLSDKKEYDKAIEYYQKSLTIKLNTFGNQHLSTAITYNNLSDAYIEKKEYDKAIEFIEKSLTIDLKLLGDQHPSSAISYFNLGSCYEGKKQYYKSKKYYQKAYEIFLNKFGEEHSNTKFVMNKIKTLSTK